MKPKFDEPASEISASSVGSVLSNWSRPTAIPAASIFTEPMSKTMSTLRSHHARFSSRNSSLCLEE